MFHVKPKMMKPVLKILFIGLAFTLIFVNTISSQNAGRFSLGSSLDYGVGKKFNNFAGTILINYNLADRVRVSPSFSSFLNKEQMKMSAFALNVHYLFPKLAENYFPILKNQEIYFYPLAGFYISNFNGQNNICNACTDDGTELMPRLRTHFGFNFGIGVEHEIPTLLPLLRDMSLNLELKYQLLDDYRRPLVSLGFLYDF